MSWGSSPLRILSSALLYFYNYGGYGSTVRTLVCGTSNEGSIPSSHPLKFTSRKYLFLIIVLVALFLFVLIVFTIRNKQIISDNLTEIGNNYYTDKQNVYYIEPYSCQYTDIENPPDCTTNLKLKDVDIDTFYVFSDIQYNLDFAKDKNNVYVKNKKLKEFDPKTFEALDFWYVKDKDKVFKEYSLVLSNKDNRMKNVDPKTFEILNENIVKDKNTVIYRDKIIEDADAESFHIIGEIYGTTYSCDKNNVYFNNNLILGVDLNSFEIISDEYSKDNKNVYKFGYVTDYSPGHFLISDEDRKNL